MYGFSFSHGNKLKILFDLLFCKEVPYFVSFISIIRLRPSDICQEYIIDTIWLLIIFVRDQLNLDLVG